MTAIIIDKIKFFLSRQVASIIVIAAAIAGRALQLLYFSYLGGDRSHQALATQNFLHGHGISIAQVLPANLSEIIYEPLIKWPPGYSFLLTPFYALFKQDYIAGGLALDLLFVIFLIFVTRNILKVLDIPVYLINLYTLITCFIIYSFYKKPYADAIAITWFLSALLLTLQLLKSPAAWKLKTIAIIFCLIFCAFSKYLYIPVVFIIPLFLVIRGVADKKAMLKKAGIFTFVITAATIAALLWYQKDISGTAVYITEPTRGFYPENLLSSYPTIPASFINPETTGLITQQDFKPGSFVYHSYQLIHLLSFLFILFCVAGIVTKNKIKQLSVANSFLYIAFFTSLTVTAVLSLLSIRVEKELDMWTYVEEARYYGLVVVLIQLSVFIVYQHCGKSFTRYRNYIFVFGLLLLLPDMLRGLVFSTKRAIRFNKEEYTWQAEYKVQQYADSIIKKGKEKYNALESVLTGSSDYMNNRVSLNSHIPMMPNTGIINTLSLINTKTPMLLLILLSSDVLHLYQAFLADPRKEVAGYLNGFYFYTVYVTPH